MLGARCSCGGGLLFQMLLSLTLGECRTGKRIVDDQDIQDSGNDRVHPAEVPGLVTVALQAIEIFFARSSLEGAENGSSVLAIIVVDILPHRRPGGHADPKLSRVLQAIIKVGGG